MAGATATGSFTGGAIDYSCCWVVVVVVGGSFGKRLLRQEVLPLVSVRRDASLAMAEFLVQLLLLLLLLLGLPHDS